MSSSNTSVPGLLLPTLQPMLAATPRLSAIQQQQNNNQYQNNLINASSGGKKRKRKNSIKIRKGGAVVVPQFLMNYQPTGGPGQTPNDLITNLSQTSTQATANSVYDNQVYGVGYPASTNTTQNGGKRRVRKSKNSKKTKKTRKSRTYKKGGNPNWKWGCYSGGK
jgi:hypothetical protein